MAHRPAVDTGYATITPTPIDRLPLLHLSRNNLQNLPLKEFAVALRMRTT